MYFWKESRRHCDLFYTKHAVVGRKRSHALIFKYCPSDKEVALLLDHSKAHGYKREGQCIGYHFSARCSSLGEYKKYQARERKEDTQLGSKHTQAKPWKEGTSISNF